MATAEKNRASRKMPARKTGGTIRKASNRGTGAPIGAKRVSGGSRAKKAPARPPVATLKHFETGQRVRIVVGNLAGRLGVVKRCCVNDASAWVAIDGGLPSGLRTFPANDSRRDHILLLPSWCAEVEAK